MSKKMKLTAILAVIVCMLLAACGGQGGTAETTTAPQSKTADYTVTVLDAKGDPYTEGVIVRFLQGGEQISMQVVDGNGQVTKNMDRGEYTVELMFTNSDVEYAYDKTNLTLTADKTALEISLAYAVAGEAESLYFQDTTQSAYYVDVCCTQVPLSAGGRSYFLFAPTQPGTYEFKAIGDVTGFGCYGTPFYVQEFSIFEVTDNTFIASVTADMIGTGGGGSTVYVIGIDSDSAESCVLSIERTGEPQWTPEQEPYLVYETTVELKPYTLPKKASLLDFDLTAATDAYTLVLNEEDGFYHLNDANGPLVLMKLGVDNKYMTCYKTVLTKTGVRKYFYNEDGSFLRREKYDDCLREYFEFMDEKNGVYPLTEDLKYILQNHGGYNGWWDLTSETSIFQDNNGEPIPGINAEIAWLFMCAYIAQ